MRHGGSGSRAEEIDQLVAKTRAASSTFFSENSPPSLPLCKNGGQSHGTTSSPPDVHGSDSSQSYVISFVLPFLPEKVRRAKEEENKNAPLQYKYVCTPAL